MPTPASVFTKHISNIIFFELRLTMLLRISLDSCLILDEEIVHIHVLNPPSTKTPSCQLSSNGIFEQLHFLNIYFTPAYTFVVLHHLHILNQLLLKV